MKSNNSFSSTPFLHSNYCIFTFYIFSAFACFSFVCSYHGYADLNSPLPLFDMKFTKSHISCLMMPQVFSVGDKYRMHTVQIYTRTTEPSFCNMCRKWSAAVLIKKGSKAFPENGTILIEAHLLDRHIIATNVSNIYFRQRRKL